MSHDYIQVGARVRCIHAYRPCKGETATIEAIFPDGSFNVRWDQTNSVGNWVTKAYFEPLDPKELDRLADLKRRTEYAMKWL